METLRLGAERLGIQLTLQQLEQFQLYYEELVAWNKKMNLTSIIEYEPVQVNHFLDSLTVLLAWEPGTGTSKVLDVGTGAGLPGIPLKIVFPQIQLFLLEATAKKTDFLKYLKLKLGFDDIEVILGRAEDVAHLSQYREQYDLVLSRAVASLAALAELALPFCKIGASFIAHKKGDISVEIEKAKKAISILGGELKTVQPVAMPEFSDNRCLIVVNKVSPTPGQYPRRSGIPAKNPLK